MPNYKDDVSNVSQTAGHVIGITGRIPRRRICCTPCLRPVDEIRIEMPLIFSVFSLWKSAQDKNDEFCNRFVLKSCLMQET